MPPIMAKKKPPKAALYVEIPADLKKRLDSLAHRRKRKLTAEVEMALERYVDEEEAREGVDPDEEGD